MLNGFMPSSKSWGARLDAATDDGRRPSPYSLSPSSLVLDDRFHETTQLHLGLSCTECGRFGHPI
jgi:hypothetical protein